MTQDEKDEHMLTVRHSLFVHKRRLERLHGITDGIFGYEFEDPAVARAHYCAELHIELMQGEFEFSTRSVWLLPTEKRV